MEHILRSEVRFERLSNTSALQKLAETEILAALIIYLGVLKPNDLGYSRTGSDRSSRRNSASVFICLVGGSVSKFRLNQFFIDQHVYYR
jgi:hypothetical protein